MRHAGSDARVIARVLQLVGGFVGGAAFASASCMQLQFVRSASATILGVRALPVVVEVSRSSGLPGVTLVGLARGAVKESLIRIRAAIGAARGIDEKNTARVVVNLLPAEVPKTESALDLAVALGLMAVDGQLAAPIAGYRFFAELSLEGRLEPVHGAALVAEASRAAGDTGLFVSPANAEEACIIPGVTVLPAATLVDVLDHLEGRRLIEPHVVAPRLRTSSSSVCMSDVQGQPLAKRALEIAAAGGHNVLMIGPPGSGKTMLARRLPSILPALSIDERIEVTRVHSAAGMLGDRGLLEERPFRAPHHTASDVALCGGGSNPRPGEISLAHKGVLFLDELPEFSRRALEALREPLEDGVVHVARAMMSTSFPAQSMFVAAMNPCPCGYFRESGQPAALASTPPCLCSFDSIQRYRSRISGPLLDRIDLHVQVDGVPWRTLTRKSAGESSRDIRRRVTAARKVQSRRLGPDRWNAIMNARELGTHAVLSPEANAIAERAVDDHGLSTRAMTRVLKVARTIADLASAPTIHADHLEEAITLRVLDRGPPRLTRDVA